jgi:hypothetical protein
MFSTHSSVPPFFVVEPTYDLPVPSEAKLIYDLIPELTDVTFGSYGTVGTGPLYAGYWWSNVVPPETLYTDIQGGVTMGLGAAIQGAVRTPQVASTLPLPTYNSPFVVEFIASFSANNADQWPGLYLEPLEHNQSPPLMNGQEFWVELDVWEGGNGLGWCGNVPIWSGPVGRATSTNNQNPYAGGGLDQTQIHSYTILWGANGKVQWYIDGKLTGGVTLSLSSAQVAHIATMHAYPVMECSSHGANVPYSMTVYRVRCWQ